MDFASIAGYVLQGLCAIVATVLWSNFTDMKKKIEKLDDELATHKIEAAGKFLTRDEMKSVVDSVNQALDRHADKLENRLDRLEKHILESR